MNKLKLLNDFKEQFSNFKIHPELISDLINIINKSGSEKIFLKKLAKGLKFLKVYGHRAHIQPTNQFESLSNNKNMYSMHIQGDAFNIRILYSFSDDGTILLYGFHEEENKKASDYSSAIPIAKKRYKEML